MQSKKKFVCEQEQYLSRWHDLLLKPHAALFKNALELTNAAVRAKIQNKQIATVNSGLDAHDENSHERYTVYTKANLLKMCGKSVDITISRTNSVIFNIEKQAAISKTDANGNLFSEDKIYYLLNKSKHKVELMKTKFSDE